MAAEMEQRRSITPGSVAYLLLLAACVALIRPFVNTGISDDFSFIRSAKDFADTGRMVYNGWSSPILGWMLPFGALFIKLFGFSFTAVRAASLMVAAVNGVLAQWILLRLGCTRGMALFGASAVLLSPISLPAAVLFFTDQPGLLALLVTLALCIRIVGAESARATKIWIAVAFLASFFLGTARQLLWSCTLLMVPSAVWLVRRRKGVVPWAAAWLSLVLAGVAGAMYWWNRQPYSMKEPLFTHIPLASWARYAVLPGMELAVEIAPVLSLFLLRRVSKRVYGVSAALALAVPLVMMRNPYDLLRIGSGDIFGEAPHWVFLAAVTYASALLPMAGVSAYEAVVRERESGELGVRGVLVLLGPFSLALFLFVSAREAFFPRYLLPVMAVVVIWLTKVWSDVRTERQGCGVAGPALVAVYCAFSIVQMHDVYRQADADLSLTEWYASQGFPRADLEAGFAFDGWYQIERTGYIDHPMVKVPAGAYVNHDVPVAMRPCHGFFLSYTPSVHPIYGVGESVAPCFQEPVMHTAEYTAWMAPHQRTVFIAQFKPEYALPVR